MADHIRITKASSADVDLVYDTCRESYSLNFANHWNEGGLDWYLDEVYGRSVLKDEIQSNEVEYHLAFVNDVAAGFMKLNLRSNLPGQPIEEGVNHNPHSSGNQKS